MEPQTPLRPQISYGTQAQVPKPQIPSKTLSFLCQVKQILLSISGYRRMLQEVPLETHKPSQCSRSGFLNAANSIISVCLAT